MEKETELNEVSSIKMELDDMDNNNIDVEPLTFSDANESISDIEESEKEPINSVINEKINETISEKVFEKVVKLDDSTTDESNTEEVKEELIESIINPIIETTEKIIIETSLNNTIKKELDNENNILSNVDVISNVTNITQDTLNTILPNISSIDKVIQNNETINIPIADIVASTNTNTIVKKHVTINEIIPNNLDIKLSVSNDSEIKIDESIILNNGIELDQASSNNTPSEISYINKIKKPDFISNKTFKHIHQNKPNKKHKNFDLDLIDTVYNKLQDYIRNIKIDRFNFFLLITKCVEIIENLSGVVENERKQLAIKSINRIITVDLNLTPFDNNYIIENIDNCIELIITASKYKSKNDKHLKNTDDNDYNIFANAGQIIPSILDKIITIILKRRYTVEKIFTNLGTLVYILILFCEQYPFLNGVEKKNIVIQTMEQLIHIRLQYIMKLTDEKKLGLIKGLDSISCIIDTLIALQKNKYKINKKNIMPSKKTFFNFLSLCSSKD